MTTSSHVSPKVLYRKKDEEEAQKLPFYQCALEVFDQDAREEEFVDSIGCAFIDNNLILYKDQSTKGLKLYHPLNCPLVHHGKTREKDMSRVDDDVRVGSAVLVRSCDGCTLLTRRSRKLRTFPGVWVPAGGHIEPGETLEEAGIRELGEEVGITFQQAEFTISTLCLFESCFPPFIEWGAPKRHHIVVYHILQTTLSKQQLSNRLELNEDEVDACAWICDQMVQVLGGDGVCESKLPPVEFISIHDGVVSHEKHAETTVFTANVSGECKHDVERLSTGTSVALQALNHLLQHNTP